MKRNTIISAFVVVVLALGLIVYFVGSDQDTTEVSTETSEEEPDIGTLVPTSGTAFRADVATTVGGTTTQGQILYNGSNAWSYQAESEDGSIEFRVIEDDFYTYNPETDTWLVYSGSGTEGSGFDPDFYDVDSEELNDFKRQANYLGKQSCPAGTCDVWYARSYDGLGDYTIAFDSQGRINQVSGSTAEGSTVIVYSYEDVTVDVPENAQTIGL